MLEREGNRNVMKINWNVGNMAERSERRKK
jgi:hypothetical protein